MPKAASLHPWLHSAAPSEAKIRMSPFHPRNGFFAPSLPWMAAKPGIGANARGLSSVGERRKMMFMSTDRVKQIADQVRELQDSEREEFLLWLSDYQLEQSDAWDRAIARDSEPGGRLAKVLDRVQNDIAQGKTRPLDEVLDDS